MIRLVLFLLAVVAVASGLAWLADRPGNLVIDWEGYQIETSVFRAVVILAALVGAAVFTWSLLRQIWTSPAAVGQFVARRRQKKGLDALSSGMIAIGAGDRAAATRYAIQARKSMPNEPLTHLLRAQAAQLSGDRSTSRRIFEAMLASPDTEALGLRGLFLEAEREGDREVARQFAERAVRLNQKLVWPIDALFDLQVKDQDWAGAIETLAIARRQGQIEKGSAERRRAVLLTAQAVDAEETDPEKSLNLALEAHGLAPDLIPAAALAARMLASRGNTPRATKIVQKTWTKAPHPDLATAYAFARLGDSPRDRLDRVRQLAALNPHSLESPIAVATTAIEAKAYDEARSVLEPLVETRLTQRICLLMARIEGEQHGDKGRVREWLARAVNAPRDPAWTADGIVSDHWAPASPITGALDAFQWRVPVESMDKSDAEVIASKLEELVPLGAPREIIERAPVTAKTEAKTETKAEPKPKPEAKPEPKPEPQPQAKVVTPVAPPKPIKSDTAVDAFIIAETPKPATGETKSEAPSPATPKIVEIIEPSAATAAASVRVAPAPAPAAVPVKPATAPAGVSATPAVVTTSPPEAKPAAVPSPAPKATPAPSPIPAKEATTAPAPRAVAAAAAPAAPSATKSPASRTEPKKGEQKRTEPRVFVSPRAPDDPGTEDTDGDDHEPRYRYQR